jgi:transcriptional regulator with XRE-family HTH domain
MSDPSLTTPLRKLRLVLGLKQSEVAEGIGLQRPNYCKIELGATPDPKTAVKISDYFGGAVTELHLMFPERFPNFLGKNFEAFRSSTAVKSREQR